MTNTKIKEHTSWICPKCKKIYDADDWAEYHKKEIRKEIQAELDDLQGAYDIAIQEINRLREKLGYDKNQETIRSIRGTIRKLRQLR
jgi:hypothetical protein